MQTTKVVVLAADLFEDLELLYPVHRLREAGTLISARVPADLGPWMKALLAALERQSPWSRLATTRPLPRG